MSSEEKKSDDKTALIISAKKYSTTVDFEEDFDSEKETNKKKSEEEIRRQEEEAKLKEEEEKLKQDLLNHWSKLLLKEPPKRRTCHTSFIHDSYFYVVGGIDITEQKQDDIYKVNLAEPNACWTKVDILGEKMGRIAYHAGAELNGFYYIIGGQDENLNTLNTIQIFDITQERLSEKLENVGLEVTLQINEAQKLELLKKFLYILRIKIKDRQESDRIKILETELEQNLLKYLNDEELILREKAILEELEKNLQTQDINKLMDSSTDIDKMPTEEINNNFSPDFLQIAITKIDENCQIYIPPLESHTVNTNEEKTLLIIYGGMTGKSYNRHVFIFDPQTKMAKNLTENLQNDQMPPPRQDHAAVIYNGCLYVYGGIGPDSRIYDDMWKFDLSSNTWEELKTEAQKNKEERRRQKIEELKQQNIEIEEEELDDYDEEEDENNKDIRPKGRSGHSMVLVGDLFYIFGGKTGLIKESNEIWEFNPADCHYECVHETLLEQFTKEELQKISSENKRDVKKFRWLTRSDIEKRTNPSFNDNKSDKDKENEKKKKQKEKNKKKENNKNGSPDRKKDAKKTDIKKSKNVKKLEKNDNKNGQNRDIEGKYADQVLCRPNVVKMRKTLIFTSDPDKIKEGLNTLANDEKENINSNIQRIKGELPEPRDGQSVCVDGSNLYIFGGDRFKFPFNDLFVLDTIQLPKLKIKESQKLKREREKEKEEKRIREQKKQEEKEEEERRREEQLKREENIKDEDEKKDEKKEENKDENKEENKDENKEDGKEENQEEEKQEENAENQVEEPKIEELRLLREILQY